MHPITAERASRRELYEEFAEGHGLTALARMRRLLNMSCCANPPTAEVNWLSRACCP
jgi:hypothetical protein